MLGRWAMQSITLDLFFGSIDFLIPVFLTLHFARWITGQYRKSLIKRRGEVPKSVNAFKLLILGCLLTFGFLSTICYMAMLGYT